MLNGWIDFVGNGVRGNQFGSLLCLRGKYQIDRVCNCC